MSEPDKKGRRISLAAIATLGVIIALAAVAVPLVIRLAGL